MESPTLAASGAAVAAAGLWATGQPPDAVLLSTLVGGFLSVWGDPPAAITGRWVASAAGRLGLSVAVGLAGAAGVPALAGGYALLAPLGHVPQWVLGGVCSLLAPVIVRAMRLRVERLAPEPEGVKQ